MNNLLFIYLKMNMKIKNDFIYKFKKIKNYICKKIN